MYYRAPADCANFFHTEAFANNPIDIEFDADSLIAMWEAGASDAELSARRRPLRRVESSAITP